jgi:hypothetical protein
MEGAAEKKRPASRFAVQARKRKEAEAQAASHAADYLCDSFISGHDETPKVEKEPPGANAKLSKKAKLEMAHEKLHQGLTTPLAEVRRPLGLMRWLISWIRSRGLGIPNLQSM